uniref:Uncharacterized protein n=1 Tax=Dulem virus 29 TaxID=3145747 RepID=A0AAU8B3N9_9CAUD
MKTYSCYERPEKDGYLLNSENHIGYYLTKTENVYYLVNSGKTISAEYCKLWDWCDQYLILADEIPELREKYTKLYK